MLACIGEGQADCKLARTGLDAVEAHRERVEKLLGGKRFQLTGRALTRHVGRRTRIAELHRGRQIEAAPRTRLRLIAHLFQRIGLQMPRIGIRRIGEDQMIDDLCDPAIIALVEGGARFLQQRIGAAGEIDIALARLDRRQLVQVCWISVEPAEITLVDSLRVVIERAVIVARVPFACERRRQRQHLGDFERRQSVIGEA